MPTKEAAIGSFPVVSRSIETREAFFKSFSSFSKPSSERMVEYLTSLSSLVVTSSAMRLRNSNLWRRLRSSSLLGGFILQWESSNFSGTSFSKVTNRLERRASSLESPNLSFSFPFISSKC